VRAHFEALRGGVEVLDDLLERFLDAVDFIAEEVVARLTELGGLCPGGHDHVVDALV
jgi:spore coat polysaccharide biosynthesis protein SpsF (cytidylyltransferase family)